MLLDNSDLSVQYMTQPFIFASVSGDLRVVVFLLSQ
jgi:hypothetical protein